MDHMLDLYVEDKYDIWIYRDGNEPVCGPEVEDLSTCLECEIYGQVSDVVGINRQFSFTVNGKPYYSSEEYEKVILCLKVEKGWRIEVKKNGEEVEPPVVLWKKLKNFDDLDLTLFGKGGWGGG